MLCVLVVAGACKIRFTPNGTSIDYNVYRTISVSEFPIRAALVYPPLQPMFENELQNYITRNTRLQTVDGLSDLRLEGEITGYNLTPAGGDRRRLRLHDTSHHIGAREIHRYQSRRQGLRPDIQRLPGLHQQRDAHRRAGRSLSGDMQGACRSYFNSTLGDW